MSLIEVRSVSKTFRRHTGRRLLREQLARLFRAHREEEVFHALRTVSFEVAEGESVALVGENGAGKSTLLSLVTGLAQPDEGTVRVKGRVAALLALGSGFHPDLTGEENVYMNAALLGFSEREAKQRFSAIVEFSEIGRFIYEPLRTYSSGMVLRLAFSVAVQVHPAILIVDEVLAVGDAHFQEKCTKRIADMRKEGVTMLWVSHSTSMVLNFCNRAIWLHRGEVVNDGPAAAVLGDYTQYIMGGSSEPPRRATLESVPSL